ncbi:SH3 domain-binding glutamic acid-rich-like protein 3 [Lingula anatina]|uniref:SH3 domain-binding glutamic acid-rich-like protein 3 n=1 Tax=Lingula anatina TaxID=7574 RepID=A0A1S3JEW8_LINAN|nr:SH3 domain-binding glutamic acid-rich-like protein 3 [Lingula anatina]XP_013408691.1 SH3 domain-binding glutamic acid-rich-like protein 3 [Lingula anatina]XP_013408693.1 SH3 domain-binding glutamic acid-rich-like protein 3 [Lingula anatina]|eukprot:XP_013408690.1 SH3 domain-binding glutamic acid-rich-like protein 3 [Lingula anatina]
MKTAFLSYVLAIAIMAACVEFIECDRLPTNGIRVYISSVSDNLELKKQQHRIQMVLSGENIDAQYIDISSNAAAKEFMREKAGPFTVPPQLFNGEEYLGDYQAFEEAVEDRRLMEFLKLN